MIEKKTQQNKISIEDWLNYISLKPVIVTYTFWENKETFMLDMDKYDRWWLFATESGKFSYQIEGVSGIGEPGDLILCPPGATFYRQVIEPLQLHSVSFDWTSDNPEIDASSIDIPFRKITIYNRNRLYENFQGMKNYRNTQLKSFDWISYYLSDIWKDWCRQNTNLQVKSPVRDELMNKIHNYIKEHAFEPMTMQMVSKQFGISPVQFIRRFRTVYLQTPNEYLTQLRLERACELLRSTSMTIEDIALQCGYSSGFYLSRVMKKQMHISPSHYRFNSQV